MDSRSYINALERHGHEQYKRYKPYLVTVPKGKSGPWQVKEFETEMGLGYLRLARDGRPPGIGLFTQLVHDQRGTVMSDTVAEIKDLEPYLADLEGNVLVSGLGLGMVVHILTTVPMYSKNIKSITVLERDQDVLNLVADHYRRSDSRIKIVAADALTWTPPKGTTYDAAWHDIWDEIVEDNRPEMTALVRRYQRRVAPGKQYCWGRYEMDRQRRRA